VRLIFCGADDKSTSSLPHLCFRSSFHLTFLTPVRQLSPAILFRLSQFSSLFFLKRGPPFFNFFLVIFFPTPFKNRFFPLFSFGLAWSVGRPSLLNVPFLDLRKRHFFGNWAALWKSHTRTCGTFSFPFRTTGPPPKSFLDPSVLTDWHPLIYCVLDLQSFFFSLFFSFTDSSPATPSPGERLAAPLFPKFFPTSSVCLIFFPRFFQLLPPWSLNFFFFF